MLYLTASALLTLIAILCCRSEDNVVSRSPVIGGVRFDEVQTILTTTTRVLHLELDKANRKSIIFSDGAQLITTDGTQQQIVTGSSSSSQTVDNGLARPFDRVTGFYQVNSTSIIVIDSGNQCLRLVDRDSNNTQPFVGAFRQSGFTDGFGSKARFFEPHSAVVDRRNRGRLIVSDSANGALRLVNLQSSEVTTIKNGLVLPQALSYDYRNKNLWITHTNHVSNFDLDTSKVKLVYGTESGYRDGWLDQVQFNQPGHVLDIDGNVILISDTTNNLLRIINVQETWVRSICTGESNTVDETIWQCGVVQPTEFLLVGDTIFFGEAGGIRRMKVSKVTQAISCPPEDIVTQVTGQELVAEVEIQPGEFLYYPPGRYNVSIPSRNCKTVVTVTQGRDSSFKCPERVLLVADETTNTGAFTMNVGNKKHKLYFDVGIHMYEISYGDVTCMTQIKVFEPQLKRRLSFEASYGVVCSSLNDSVNTQLIDTVATYRYASIEELCDADCPRSADLNITKTCEDDILTITWPTSVVYPADHIRVPEKLESALKSNLDKSRHVLDLVLLDHNPPVLSPLLGDDGLVVQPVLTTICEGGYLYDAEDDRCLDPDKISENYPEMH